MPAWKPLSVPVLLVRGDRPADGGGAGHSRGEPTTDRLLAQSHPRPSAVLVNELDAGGFQGAANG